MRRTFFKLLHAAMAKDDRIVLMVGDLGFSLIEPIRDDFPDRFFNIQAAEFTMIGSAIGQSYTGKIVVAYSITPFIVLRPFELLRTYVNHEKIPIKIVGGGRDNQYNGGISHYAGDIPDIMRTLPNILRYTPENNEQLDATYLEEVLYNEQPSFLSLSK